MISVMGKQRIPTSEERWQASRAYKCVVPTDKWDGNTGIEINETGGVNILSEAEMRRKAIAERRAEISRARRQNAERQKRLRMAAKPHDDYLLCAHCHCWRHPSLFSMKSDGTRYKMCDRCRESMKKYKAKRKRVSTPTPGKRANQYFPYDTATQKMCSKCGQLLSRDQFHRDSRSPDGLMRVCKSCKSQKAKEYYARIKS